MQSDGKQESTEYYEVLFIISMHGMPSTYKKQDTVGQKNALIFHHLVMQCSQTFFFFTCGSLNILGH